jgi:hypothetical protein
MPRYNVTGTVVGSKYLGEFEAETEEQAVEIALSSNSAYVSLCHHCAGECGDAEIRDGVA